MARREQFAISRGNQRQKIYKDDLDCHRFDALLGQVPRVHLTEA
jgi:hypothetical protein